MMSSFSESTASPIERSNWLGDVARIAPPTPAEFLVRYVSTRTPVIIRGLMDAWPAMKWTPESLVQRIGARPVDVRVLDERGVTRYDDPGIEVPFDEFISAIGQDPPAKRYYLALGNVWSTETGRFPNPDFPELRGDFKRPAILRQFPMHETNLWIGYSGTVSNLHFDTADNVLCVLRGVKCLRLFAPDQSANVYQPSLSHPGNELHSPVDVAAPDYERYTRFRRAKFHTVRLEPGDALFLPAGHWHYVQSFGLSMAINFWWAAPLWSSFQVRSPMRAQWLRHARERASDAGRRIATRIRDRRRGSTP